MSNVTVSNVSAGFDSTDVLHSVNLVVNKGEFVVLLGPSGCGKSTLLNCIAGLHDVSAGQVFIADTNVTWAEPRDRGIGMVFQSYALYPQMSVEKNLSFSLRVRGMPTKEIAKRVAHAAEILKIESLLKRKPATLSGGQRQRVAIGRALVRNVDVFLFDEPLSNLDAQLRSDLRVEIKRLHQRLANTMLYVTHDQVEALTLADKIAVMEAGVIQQFGPPHELYSNPVNRFVAGFVGSPAMNFLSGKVHHAQDQWWFVSTDMRFPITGCPLHGPLAEGQSVELGIRPEHVKLGVLANGLSSAITLQVELVELMGADQFVWAGSENITLRARVDAGSNIEHGSMILLGFDPSHALLFDQDGQRV